MYPIDIQSAAQAIQTFTFVPQKYQGDPDWAVDVAGWAIQNMYDPDGFFYFRKNRCTLNKTAFLHWGQATMLSALAALYQAQQVSRPFAAGR
jgi:hypothetical protein